MIHKKRPRKFNPQEIIGCTVVCNGEFLLLLRQDHKTAGNKWGEPAGKVEKGEDKFDAILRELFEETGIKKEKDEIIFRHTLFISGEYGDLIYHSFGLRLSEKPEIIIEPDCHKEFRWVRGEDMLELDLIHDEDALISTFV